MRKKIVFGKELHKIAHETMDLMHKAVSSTLGPSGKLALLERPGQSSLITKDGVTVARSLLPLYDKSMDVIAQQILDISSMTNAKSGDGTTTAIVLAKAIYDNAIKIIDIGVDPVVVKKEIEEGLQFILNELDKKAKPIETLEEMISVATISANNDKAVGEIVAKAIDSVGLDGHVVLESYEGIEPKMTLIEGMTLSKGVPDIRYIKNKNAHTFDNPYILIYDGKLDNPEVMINIYQSYLGGRPFIFIGELADIISKMFIQNLGQGIEFVHVEPFGYKNTRLKVLEDIAIATGGQVINPSFQNPLSIRKDQLGQADKISLSLYKTTIVGGKGKKEEILKRIDELKEEIKEAPSEYDKVQIRERIGKLATGVCILSVGGVTESEMLEKKDRFEDSLNATKAALEEGIIDGGGFTLYNIAKQINPKSNGERILKESIVEPIKQIIKNTGYNPEDVLEKLTEDEGYDAKNHRYCKLTENGIVDPVKVTKTALLNAVSIVDLLINLEVLSVEVKSQNQSVVETLEKISEESI